MIFSYKYGLFSLLYILPHVNLPRLFTLCFILGVMFPPLSPLFSLIYTTMLLFQPMIYVFPFTTILHSFRSQLIFALRFEAPFPFEFGIYSYIALSRYITARNEHHTSVTIDKFTFLAIGTNISANTLQGHHKTITLVHQRDLKVMCNGYPSPPNIIHSSCLKYTLSLDCTFEAPRCV